MDFTLYKYKQLLIRLKDCDYSFFTYKDYLHKDLRKRYVILRHDVDLLPMNSLAIALLEAELNIKATYYFRAVPESWNENVIKEIVSLGHEVGYHYESLSTCKGDIDNAYKDFTKNLSEMRKLVIVDTICMHGSPRSPFDSKDIWNKYNYKDLGIIGEPYLDTDFSQLLYLTDTGRRWDGFKVSVRDKIVKYQDEWIKLGLTYHTTNDIIKAIDKGLFPPKVMITTHPQRWNDFGRLWLKEFFLQNMKNIVKSYIVKFKS